MTLLRVNVNTTYNVLCNCVVFYCVVLCFKNHDKPPNYVEKKLLSDGGQLLTGTDAVGVMNEKVSAMTDGSVGHLL